jgi:hypothetical protein
VLDVLKWKAIGGGGRRRRRRVLNEKRENQAIK